MPRAVAASIRRAALATRSSALAGMPPSPLAARMTAHEASAAMSRTSGRSMDAELSISRPRGWPEAATPAASTATSEESIETGTVAVLSTVVTSQVMAWARIPESAETSSTLRSSQSAPVTSWRWASVRM